MNKQEPPTSESEPEPKLFDDVVLAADARQQCRHGRSQEQDEKGSRRLHPARGYLEAQHQAVDVVTREEVQQGRGVSNDHPEEDGPQEDREEGPQSSTVPVPEFGVAAQALVGNHGHYRCQESGQGDQRGGVQHSHGGHARECTEEDCDYSSDAANQSPALRKGERRGGTLADAAEALLREHEQACAEQHHDRRNHETEVPVDAFA
jgi:hypothetical protein